MYVRQAATFEVLQVLHSHNLPGHAVWSEQNYWATLQRLLVQHHISLGYTLTSTILLYVYIIYIINNNIWTYK